MVFCVNLLLTATINVQELDSIAISLRVARCVEIRAIKDQRRRFMGECFGWFFGS